MEQVHTMGAVGAEMRLPLKANAQRALSHALTQNDLACIGVAFTGGGVLPNRAWTVGQHLQRLRETLDGAALVQLRFLNLLAGNDRWCLGQLVDFFAQAQAMADDAGVVCSWETHRGSALYSPWVTLALIEQLPQLRSTADISHWVVVCERLLNDPQDDLSASIDRVHHVQARVGYDQGPQVPHPNAPEYAREVAFHQGLWQSVWASRARRGYATSTLTPEFGPNGYTHLLPFTQAPVADLQAVNLGMAISQRAQFDAWNHHIGVTH